MLRVFAKDLFYPAANNFSGIPSELIRKFERSESSKKVVFFLIDAFGSNQFEKAREGCKALAELCKSCTIDCISTQFPSTTTANVTTAFFNLSVGQHGLYEWQIYEPLCDGVFMTLPYRGTMGTKVPQVEELLPFQTLFEQLTQYDVESTVVSPAEYLHSPYNRVAVRGAKYAGYNRSNWEGVLSDALSEMSDRSYLYFYFPYIDEAGHNFGPESGQVSQQISQLFAGLTRVLSHAKEIEWLLTADHGMVSVDPKRTIRLDLECPWLLPMLRTNRSGQLIGPAGSERDLFIHTTEPEAVCERLQSFLGDRAEVHLTSHLMELGFFGKIVSDRLRERVGNVVVLPVEGESVWMMENLDRLGQHGGLTRKELEISVLRSS